MQSDPSQRNLNLMSKYNGTHGHRTEDCRQLMEEVARLFNEGHLRKFLSDRAKNHFRERDAGRKNEPEEPQHVIHMIVGGVYVPQGPIFKLQVQHVLGDRGSSANIIRSRVVEQLGLLDQIIPAPRVLNDYNMASETILGEIILLVNVAGTVQETKFHVIEGDMSYTSLLGRPWIHNMRAVPSTVHQMMKFPTEGWHENNIWIAACSEGNVFSARLGTSIGIIYVEKIEGRSGGKIAFTVRVFG
ncbi:PREDICTED: uncharacterized protein LOC109236458 [Nicotiana attenuata]|uniref:uncharacterized protein LOC109236458 n=1 Tax=Nicotiana attenuata TaxID=49451 RepID=UPI0009051839|nr:PREDICTED: uncharacterized protein LOC109236458 [Nicotiana attenuata]